MRVQLTILVLILSGLAYQMLPQVLLDEGDSVFSNTRTQREHIYLTLLVYIWQHTHDQLFFQCIHTQ